MPFQLKYLVYITELISAVVGFMYIRKWQTTIWRWFAFFLMFMVIGECVGESLSVVNSPITRKLNVIWYDNIVIPSEFLYFFWIFYLHNENPIKKRLPLAFIIIYIISLASDIFIFQAHFHAQQLPFNSFSYTIGNILLLYLILNYYSRMANSQTVMKLNENMLFWISTGLLIYYLGTCPFWGLRNIIINYKSLYEAYNAIQLILDFLMYLTFTFSIIWVKANSTNS